MNIGILGTGFMAKIHAQIYKSLADVKIVGMAGRDGLRAEEAAQNYGAKAYENPSGLFKEASIDVIDVCLPTAIHAEYAIEALKSGKHVFCETPLTYEIEDAEKMLEASKQTEKKLMVALYDRFQSQYMFIHEFIKSGKIGKLKAIFANRRSQSYFASKDIVLNLMIHDIDYICWLLGMPESVYCRGISSDKGIDEHASAILEYADMSVSVEGSVILPKSFPFSTSLRVVCENGALDLDWHMEESGPVNNLVLYTGEGRGEKLDIMDYDPYSAECMHFIKCVKGEADSSVFDIKSALDSIKVAVSVRESFRKGGMKIRI